MSDRFEDRIRDFLADNLDLIERGLILVRKEYELPNGAGAGGRIDILARDVYGHVVIIEIKRSDQAARQALNEIHKYTALFRISQGLDETRLRLIVVSTDWHELRLPLSEYAESTRYSVEGVEIVATSDGKVTRASKIPLTEKTAAITISRVQCIYLYRTQTQRDECLNALIAAIKGACIEDFAIFRCDHSGSNRRVVHPYGHYLCFSSPAQTLTADEFEQCKARIGWEDGLNQPDENFIANVNNAFVGLPEDMEPSFPEKLTTLCSEWAVSVFLRSGRLGQENAVLTDQEILRLAQSVEGGSDTYLHRILSPRFASAWKRLTGDLDLVLLGNSVWHQIVPKFLSEAAAIAPTATVSISVFNPVNLFLSLYWVAWNQDYSRCPHLEIVVEDGATQPVRILVGILTWDGKRIEAKPDQIMNSVYGSDADWMAAVAFHQTFEREDSALAAHHLRAAAVEWCFDGKREIGPTEIFVENSELRRRPFDEIHQDQFRTFVASHRDYLASLKSSLESKGGGLPGSPV